MVNSGQFIIPDTALELSLTNFSTIVSKELNLFSRYFPLRYRFNLDTVQREHTFLVSSTPYGIPESISKVIPVRLYTSPFNQANQNHNKNTKTLAPFRYIKPKLYIAFAGTHDISARFYYKSVDTGNVDTNGNPIYDIANFDDTIRGYDIFIELITGKFMQVIGRSRGVVSHNDLPMSDDGKDLVSDGKTIYESAMKRLITEGLWSSSWG